MFELISSIDLSQVQPRLLTGPPERWEEISPKGQEDILLVRYGENIYWCTDIADLRAIGKALGRPETLKVSIVTYGGMLFEAIDHIELAKERRSRKPMFILPLPGDKHGNIGLAMAVIELEAVIFPRHHLFLYKAPRVFATTMKRGRSDAFRWVEVSGPARYLSGTEYALIVEEAAAQTTTIEQWQVIAARKHIGRS